MRKTILVVPTCRPESLGAFFDAWKDRGGWDGVCIIEDAPEKSAEVAALLKSFPPTLVKYHYAHTDITTYLGDNAWIISRRDSAIRCFGFLVPYCTGMDLVTLDDDCFPLAAGYDGGSFVGCHRKALVHPRWVESVPGVRTRGLPYRNLGTLEASINVGLWTGVPDLDGPQGLLHPISDFSPPSGNRLIPNGQYAPICGMNLFAHHDAIPLLYFPLMGEGQPYRRFDDIWGGILAKRALDALGWSLSVGEPFVEHRRASDPFANLVREAPGIVANESFWETVDAVPLPVGNRQPTEIMDLLGICLETNVDPYIRRLGGALRVWTRLLGDSFSPQI